MNNIEEELMNYVEHALEDLYEKDDYLIKNDTSERNIVFHFGRYFINYIEKKDSFNKFNVDCEYNRDIFDENMNKKINCKGEVRGMIPDLILHERGTNDNNILAIEFKKYSNNDKEGIKNDYLKLEALTDNTMHFKYKLGLFIRLGKTKEKIEIEKFINGKRIIEKKKLLI